SRWPPKTKPFTQALDTILPTHALLASSRRRSLFLCDLLALPDDADSSAPGHWPTPASPRCPTVSVTSEAHREQNLRRHHLTPSPPQHQSRSQQLPRHRQDLLPACRKLHPPPSPFTIVSSAGAA
uniref:Uncharacterized protein n=4 Tax=Aegilops tauschii subsp. strangulata TaxID=200361 RepID=A0A453FDH7_AEGTS